jgi:hypothetical protein
MAALRGENRHREPWVAANCAGHVDGGATMNWRSATWAQWLDWTVVFGLVVGGSALAYYVLQAAIPSVLSALFVVPTLVAAVLIGVRFPSWWWGLGPPALFLAPATALFLPDPNAGLVLGWVIVPLRWSASPTASWPSSACGGATAARTTSRFAVTKFPTMVRGSGGTEASSHPAGTGTVDRHWGFATRSK